jgi:hypothetical protein
MTRNERAGLGYPSLLTLIFITLKLLGVIAWSWWWVLAPLWLPVVLLLFIALVVFICLCIFKPDMVGSFFR